MQRRGSRRRIQATIFEHDVGRAKQFAGSEAAARTLFAAHLEQIGEVVVEQQGQVECRRPVAVILQTDPLIGGSAPQEDGAHDVQHVLLQDDTAIAIDVGIGEVDGQRRIVIAQVGAQQQRLHRIQHQFEAGEITGVGVEQAVRSAGGCADIAVTVEHGECVVMLERAARSRRRPGHRDIERRFRNQFDGRDRLDVGYHFG